MACGSARFYFLAIRVQSVGRIGLTIRGQLRDMRFIRLPGQIAHMGLADDHLPLLTG
jgi:hypothetical protein